jgi:hypothetical protein
MTAELRCPGDSWGHDVIVESPLGQNPVDPKKAMSIPVRSPAARAKLE